MRYAILNLDYVIENIIEIEEEFYKTIMGVLVDDSDVCIGDAYDTSILWFKDNDGNKRGYNSEYGKINIDVVDSIRIKYSESDELKLLRVSITDNQNAEFLSYNTFVEECRTQGKTKKQALLESYYKHLLAVELEVTQ